MNDVTLSFFLPIIFSTILEMVLMYKFSLYFIVIFDYVHLSWGLNVLKLFKFINVLDLCTILKTLYSFTFSFLFNLKPQRTTSFLHWTTHLIMFWNLVQAGQSPNKQFKFTGYTFKPIYLFCPFVTWRLSFKVN